MLAWVNATDFGPQTYSLHGAMYLQTNSKEYLALYHSVLSCTSAAYMDVLLSSELSLNTFNVSDTERFQPNFYPIPDIFILVKHRLIKYTCILEKANDLQIN